MSHKSFLFIVLIFGVLNNDKLNAQSLKATVVTNTNNNLDNSFYQNNRAPLLKNHFIKLPVGTIKPGGWLKNALNLQKNGLTGNLGEISIWLSKEDNAWLHKDGKGKYGWEELPYWLKGYANIGYMLNDSKMISEAKFWLNAAIDNQRENGDFGPLVEKGEGKRDLWTNMPMLWCLQSYYEYSGDKRVITMMTKYFKWQLSIPDDKLLEDYWEKSRGGDNIISIYWLYNKTGDKFLLDLATKIDKNTSNWRQANNLPNWHNVNIAQCFREPATYYLQSHNKSDLEASYNNQKLIREIYGQVPGGMFGGDENSRKGYDDPRQAVETCGLVEQMTSDQMMLAMTGDIYWAENCEDVAFNTFSAAFTPDYKALRYLTAPNMVISDAKNHHPGIDNTGPFLMMNPFSSRCCQHNHAAGWVYHAENTWMATPDNGVAAQLYAESSVNIKVGNGANVTLNQKTKYPFEDMVNLDIATAKSISFPLYLRVPAWCANPIVKVNGKIVSVDAKAGSYIKLENLWKNGDKISLQLPMDLKLREWEKNKNSISINYGPLTYSLKIDEEYIQKDSKETAIGDSRWQKGADPQKWPSFEIHPKTDWNYGLVVDKNNIAKSFSVIKKQWPKDNNPFTNSNAPIEIKATGKRIPEWKIDQYGLVDILPKSPLKSNETEKELTLVPMGGARLRISAFPVVN
ncbi:glycoside hydrolase family 127 protein [Pedobacter aquatilis]|uniref:beta-L-arabinofuranosidase domain-containing protein n=1 Tax=Pedobacter aquatilis TaxID=351343 RepID=UPI0025B44F7A|nr:beta-L-arabinofuranosidase domain-containing protein [Pedobacter aquatilis]MDN3588378.1 glycoside hydrolase family 127 protein [Pedobacter aquatilis]